MKTVHYLFFFAALVLGCSEKRDSSIHSVSPVEFNSLLTENEDALLIDVRTPEEFQESHISNAQLINFYDQDFKEKISDLPKDKITLIYCASGVRSAKAASVFEERGFKNIYVLEDGLKKWKELSLPLSN